MQALGLERIKGSIEQHLVDPTLHRLPTPPEILGILQCPMLSPLTSGFGLNNTRRQNPSLIRQLGRLPVPVRTVYLGLVK